MMTAVSRDFRVATYSVVSFTENQLSGFDFYRDAGTGPGAAPPCRASAAGRAERGQRKDRRQACPT